MDWLAGCIVWSFGPVGAALLLAGFLAGFLVRHLHAARTSSLAAFAFEGIALCDARGRIVQANPAFAALLGRTPASLRGTAFRGLFRDLQADALRRGQPAACLSDGVLVEVLARPLSGGRVALALRDLRDRVATQERLLHEARHDPLTGLPGRALFEDRMAQALAGLDRGGPGFALMYLDLDHFKAINDTHGHAAGDLVLREVGRRLRAATRPGDAVARLGGDEFVVLQPDDGRPGGAAAMAQRLVALLSRPYALGEGRVGRLSVSIGIARCPADAASAGEVLQRADRALYAVKDRGRNGVAFYRPSAQAPALL
jgi:diguanylate cyclase (GGDEF)-like protein